MCALYARSGRAGPGRGRLTHIDLTVLLFMPAHRRLVDIKFIFIIIYASGVYAASAITTS